METVSDFIFLVSKITADGSKESWSPVGRMTKRTHCAEDGGGHWFILTLERGQGDGTGPGETEAAQVGAKDLVSKAATKKQQFV